MNFKHASRVPAEPIKGLSGVTDRWLWTAKDGVPVFTLQLFEVEPEASTFYHTHAHEHEAYALVVEQYCVESMVNKPLSLTI